MPALPTSASHARVLGVVGMLASPLMLVEMVRFDFAQSRMDGPTSLGGAVYMLGVLATLAGLRRMRAAGDGRSTTVLHWFQLAAATAALCWSAAFLFTGPRGGHGLAWTVGDAAWPLTHLSMLALGIHTVAARRLAGWRRYAPLVAGLALPAFFALAASSVPAPMAAASFGVLTTAGFFLLGYTVFTTPNAG
jgi:membrane protein DedA with SNARE-associated domain